MTVTSAANRVRLHGRDSEVALVEDLLRRVSEAGKAGSYTDLTTPTGLALDAEDNIYVANSIGNSITVYAAGTTGNVAPIRTIAGSLTNLAAATGIAFDAAGNIYVANSNVHQSGEASITVFAAGANGNVSPIEMIAGTKTKLLNPYGLARDGSGNIHVANYAGSFVATFRAGAKGDPRPIHALKGRRTTLKEPIGIAIQ
jgi:6-phosphogluconolactonase (cycloisomerase 2 family)